MAVCREYSDLQLPGCVTGGLCIVWAESDALEAKKMVSNVRDHCGHGTGGRPCAGKNGAGGVRSEKLITGLVWLQAR